MRRPWACRIDGGKSTMTAPLAHLPARWEFAMGVLLELLGGLLLVALIVRGVFGFVDDIKRRHHRG
jgi:hypothetical protein